MIEWLRTEREQRGKQERKEGIESTRGRWKEGKGMELLDGEERNGRSSKNRRGRGNERRNKRGIWKIYKIVA